MEASLLPSKETKALCEKVPVAAARSLDKACEDLKKEFGFLNGLCWVLVLDGRNETLAGFIVDSIGLGCNQESVGRFPGLLVAKIEECLRRPMSAQELARRWEKDPVDEAAFQNLEERLAEMQDFPQLAKLCDKAASNDKLPKAIRDTFRIRSHSTRFFSEFESSAPRARYVEEGEGLLVELPDHKLAPSIISNMIGVLSYEFDVPSKVAGCVSRLENRAANLPQPEPLRRRIKELSDQGARRIADVRKRLAEVPERPSWTHQRALHAAFLGDARATAAYFSQPPHKERLRFQEWVGEAREKLGKEPKE